MVKQSKRKYEPKELERSIHEYWKEKAEDKRKAREIANKRLDLIKEISKNFNIKELRVTDENYKNEWISSPRFYILPIFNSLEDMDSLEKIHDKLNKLRYIEDNYTGNDKHTMSYDWHYNKHFYTELDSKYHFKVIDGELVFNNKYNLKDYYAI